MLDANFCSFAHLTVVLSLHYTIRSIRRFKHNTVVVIAFGYDVSFSSHRL